ncbi:MAG TPA: 2-phospho-L-lactate guanylyltransferase [Methanoregulaceae archaeon]|nr:2-phospho-L-lactate guanylyltransferase [Methanoregulaceae archaeon]
MSVTAVVPFRPVNPKSRLSHVLSKDERECFAEAMLSDIVTALRGAGCSPFILSTVPLHCSYAEVQVSDQELNPALNALLGTMKGPLLIIMADLPLVDPDVIRRILSTTADVALGPGRGGGTNAIFVKDCSRFHVDYYGASFLKHKKIAEGSGLSCEIIDSFRLHTDVDEEEDLVELLIHGTGRAAGFLRSCGLELLIEKGRVNVRRLPQRSGSGCGDR